MPFFFSTAALGRIRQEVRAAPGCHVVFGQVREPAVVVPVGDDLRDGGDHVLDLAEGLCGTAPRMQRTRARAASAVPSGACAGFPAASRLGPGAGGVTGAFAGGDAQDTASTTAHDERDGTVFRLHPLPSILFPGMGFVKDFSLAPRVEPRLFSLPCSRYFSRARTIPRRTAI